MWTGRSGIERSGEVGGDKSVQNALIGEEWLGSRIYV